MRNGPACRKGGGVRGRRVIWRAGGGGGSLSLRAGAGREEGTRWLDAHCLA